MSEIKITRRNVEDMIVLSDVVGMKVIDNRGKDIGTIRNIHLDPYNFSVAGITIDNGMFQGEDFVDSAYIGSLSEEGAVLLITPISQYTGMKVFDSKGEKIGKVRDVMRVKKTNSVISITVNRGIGKEDIIITDNFIKEVGENIVLNDTVNF